MIDILMGCWQILIVVLSLRINKFLLKIQFLEFLYLWKNIMFTMLIQRGDFSRLGHHFSMVLPSLSDSWHYPPVVSGKWNRWQHLVKCAGLMSSWNLQLGKSEVQRRVVDLSFRPMPDNLRKVGWAALRVLSISKLTFSKIRVERYFFYEVHFK